LQGRSRQAQQVWSKSCQRCGGGGAAMPATWVRDQAIGRLAPHADAPTAIRDSAEAAPMPVSDAAHSENQEGIGGQEGIGNKRRRPDSEGSAFTVIEGRTAVRAGEATPNLGHCTSPDAQDASFYDKPKPRGAPGRASVSVCGTFGCTLTNGHLGLHLIPQGSGPRVRRARTIEYDFKYGAKVSGGRHSAGASSKASPTASGGYGDPIPPVVGLAASRTSDFGFARGVGGAKHKSKPLRLRLLIDHSAKEAFLLQSHRPTSRARAERSERSERSESLLHGFQGSHSGSGLWSHHDTLDAAQRPPASALLHNSDARHSSTPWAEPRTGSDGAASASGDFSPSEYSQCPAQRVTRREIF